MKFKKIQFIFFLVITVILVITLGLKFIQNQNAKAVIATKTFIPKLQKMITSSKEKSLLNLKDSQLFLLAIPSTDYLSAHSENTKNSSTNDLGNTDGSYNEEDTSSTGSYPYDYIALLDKDMNILLEAGDTYIENSELGVIDKATPLILGQHIASKKSNTKKYTYGVYDLNQNKWLIKRIYTYLYELDDEYYVAYDEEYKPYLFHKDGSKVFDESFDSNTTFKLVGNNIVALNEDLSTVSLYTSSGKLIKTIETKYVTVYKNYIVASNVAEDSIIYDANGNEIFSKDTLIKKNNLSISSEENMTIYQFNEESLFVEAQISHYFFITKLDGTIIKELDQQIAPDTNLGLVSNGYFTYTNDLSQLSFYSESGNKYLASDGNDYSDFVYPKYYYYSKDKKIELYDYTSKESLFLDVSTLSSPYLSGVYKDFVFIFSHDDLNSVLIFYKDHLIYEGTQSYIELINDNIVVTNVSKDLKIKTNISTDEDSAFTPYSALMDSKHIIFNQKGDKIYESKKNEKILSINDTYLQVMRDNSIGIMDYDGNFLCKINLTANK